MTEINQEEVQVEDVAESGVEVTFAHGGGTPEITAFDDKGNQIPVPYRLQIRPFFIMPGSRAPFMYVRSLRDITKSDGEVASGMLSVAGANGQIYLGRRVRSAKPTFESVKGPLPVQPVKKVNANVLPLKVAQVDQETER